MAATCGLRGRHAAPGSATTGSAAAKLALSFVVFWRTPGGAALGSGADRLGRAMAGRRDCILRVGIELDLATGREVLVRPLDPRLDVVPLAVVEVGAARPGGERGHHRVALLVHRPQ